MITKAQLFQSKDSNNQCTLNFSMKWNETSLARQLDALDGHIEDGYLAEIVSAEPLSFDKEKGRLIVKIVFDVTEILEEFDPEAEEENEAQLIED